MARVRFHDHMNVIASHMRGPETPAAVQADFAESVEYGHTAVSVKEIGQLVHLLAHHRDTLWIRLRQSAAGNLVVPVDCAGFVAVQVRPITTVAAPFSVSLVWPMLPRIYHSCVAHPFSPAGIRA